MQNGLADEACEHHGQQISTCHRSVLGKAKGWANKYVLEKDTFRHTWEKYHIAR